MPITTLSPSSSLCPIDTPPAYLPQRSHRPIRNQDHPSPISSISPIRTTPRDKLLSSEAHTTRASITTDNTNLNTVNHS